jgi:hypothetical protein
LELRKVGGGCGKNDLCFRARAPEILETLVEAANLGDPRGRGSKRIRQLSSFLTSSAFVISSAASAK